ncbi:hypothetical protein [Ferrovum sp.]|jgi:hypothetical protein|uniref:hypothetical protein n=1 Tax=Ferrovum sp. TaxID=2609467 RepID=UPI00261C3F3C|nr:hypothetical protein [Ferrovum sp.]
MIDFVSIADAVAEIAKNQDQSLSDVAKASKAASILHREIHNNETAFQWYEIDEGTSQPLKCDSCAKDAMAMLKHAAGWAQRAIDHEIKTVVEHVGKCKQFGLDPDKEPMQEAGRCTSDGQWDWPRFGAFREYVIGFDRDVKALEKSVQESQAEPQKSAADRHGDTILEAIISLGLDPLALEGNSGRIGGDKQKVRDKTTLTADQFNTGWKTLTSARKIRYNT